MEFNIELPVNGLSFGQMGVGLLIEIYRRDLSPSIWPIGQVDLTSYDLPDGFQEWFSDRVTNSRKKVGQHLPYFRLWHLQDSEKMIPAKRSVLWTAHECSETTDVERQICSLYDKVLLTSEYSRDIFNNEGVKNAEFCPDFFDYLHFRQIETRKQPGIINFSLIGKLEKRKNTHQILATWASKYGGNDNYRLNCLINNPFLPPEINIRSVDSIFKGSRPGNINLLPRQVKNAAVNELVNFCDIDISGLSGSEGWNLPAFNACALGKQVVVMNAHAHKSWANSKNSILVKSSGKQDIYDATFFSKGLDFNQGNMDTFDPSDAISAFEEASKRVVSQKENKAGILLQKKFSVSNSLDKILTSLFE